MVDAHVSGACGEIHKGSSPFFGIFYCFLCLKKELLMEKKPNFPKSNLSDEEIRELLKLIRQQEMNDPNFRKWRAEVRARRLQQLPLPLPPNS